MNSQRLMVQFVLTFCFPPFLLLYFYYKGSYVQKIDTSLLDAYDKMSKQIVPLNVDYSSKKEEKSNMILMKLRKGKMEWVFYDSLDKEQLKLILDAYHLKIIL